MLWLRHLLLPQLPLLLLTPKLCRALCGRGREGIC
jgi:hypothetical protein